LGGCFEGHGVIKGGTIRYQPKSASAAAWRGFILFSDVCNAIEYPTNDCPAASRARVLASSVASSFESRRRAIPSNSSAVRVRGSPLRGSANDSLVGIPTHRRLSTAHPNHQRIRADQVVRRHRHPKLFFQCSLERIVVPSLAEVRRRVNHAILDDAGEARGRAIARAGFSNQCERLLLNSLAIGP
jgi:hypothetical protein